MDDMVKETMKKSKIEKEQAYQILNEQDRERVRSRFDELISRRMNYKDAFNQAWNDVVGF